MSITGTPLTRVVDAIAFAAHEHRKQKRKDKDKTPYINHPVALVRILALEGGIEDADVLCAAALHDYLEDCCGKKGQLTVEEGRQLLRERFGTQVLAYVDELTDDKSLPKAKRKEQQVKKAAQATHGAKLIKLADKTANLRDLIDFPPVSWDLQRRHKYFDWAAQVVEQVRGAHAGLEVLFDQAYAHRPAAAAPSLGAT